MIDLKHYAGREQAYVKHLLLETYLRALIHKTASKYNHIVYVDGFAGPWQANSEDYKDTSFGIALRLLTEAKASWIEHGRDVSMTALLVEKNRNAYARLATIGQNFPQVSVRTFQGDFIEQLPSLFKAIPQQSFTFFLIDPKGWKIPLNQLAPLLNRNSSEVLFNFMFDFINRFAAYNDPQVIEGLQNLMPFGDWRARLRSAVESGVSPEERRSILVEAFSENLRKVGRYKYICETTILQRKKDRALYSLFYGTRHEVGLEVFRDCQVKAISAQSKTREQTKLNNASILRCLVPAFDGLDRV